MNSTVLMSMNGAGDTHTNGEQPASGKPGVDAWLRQSVQQFFSGINWDNHAPEVQHLKAVAASDQPLDLTLPVSQFLGAINWEGGTIASLPTLDDFFASASSPDAFTLDDFSDLF